MQQSRRVLNLFVHLDHYVGDLNILLSLVLGRHLEDDILLVLRHGLLTDMLDELAHPARS